MPKIENFKNLNIEIDGKNNNLMQNISASKYGKISFKLNGQNNNVNNKIIVLHCLEHPLLDQEGRKLLKMVMNLPQEDRQRIQALIKGYILNRFDLKLCLN